MCIYKHVLTLVGYFKHTPFLRALQRIKRTFHERVVTNMIRRLALKR